MKILTLLFITYFSIFSFRAQLSGFYTAGSPTDDFPTIQNAIDAISIYGLDGSVTIQISSGTYNSIVLSNISPPPSEKLIFTSATQNAVDVILDKASLINCERIEFHDLSFIKQDSTATNSVVDIRGCKYAKLIRCNIKDTYKYTNVWQHSALYVDHGWSSGANSVYVDHCFITSKELALPIDPSRSTVFLKNENGTTFFYDDSIVGSIQSQFNTIASFRKCKMYGVKDMSGLRFDYIDSCELHMLFPSGGFDLNADEITNSKFYTTNGSSLLSARKLINNYVEGNTRSSGGNFSKHQDNYFNGNFNYYIAGGPISLTNAIVESNIIRGKSFLSGNSGSSVMFSNNSFFDTVDARAVGYGEMNFFHNNFHQGSLFYFLGSGKLYNNNFGDVSINYVGQNFSNGTKIIDLSHNNFNYSDSLSLFYSFYDDHPTYYDPAFDTLTGLHLRNPAIFSSNNYLNIAFTNNDMDDEVRSQKPSIGADETCLSIPLPDSIFLKCGASYTLKICDSLADNLHWGPSSLFIDTQAIFPELVVDTVSIVYLLDSLENTVDSIVLIPNQLNSIKRNLYGLCGRSYKISTFQQEGSTLAWSPGNLFSDTSSYITTFTSDTSTWVVATTDLGACGIYHDSIYFNINRIPSSNFYVDSQTCLGRRYRSNTICFDSTKWVISDGTTYDNQTVIWHEFQSGGIYTITYNVWLDDSLSSKSISNWVSCVGVDEDEILNFSIYPNPCGDQLTIQTREPLSDRHYTIYNLGGQLVQQGDIHETDNSIQLTNLADGTYILKLGSNTKSFTKKGL